MLDDRHHPAQFLSLAHGRSARARGFATDVENLRALLDQLQSVRHRCRRVQEPPPVEEGIGGDVHDAHHQRRPWEGELKLAGAQDHVSHSDVQ